MHGTSYYKGLVGGNPTGLTRFLEFVDGSIMTDGHFSDASGTWIGDILYGGWTARCFTINEEGNVERCEKLCTDKNANPMECEQVLCEKALSPIDKALCLDKSSVVPSKVTLDNSFDITIPVSCISSTIMIPIQSQ